MSRINKVFLAIILLCSYVTLAAQNLKPLTSQEVVSLLYQLQRNPDMRDDLVEQIRKRGIGFALTDGMRSLVATKMGLPAGRLAVGQTLYFDDRTWTIAGT